MRPDLDRDWKYRRAGDGRHTAGLYSATRPRPGQETAENGCFRALVLDGHTLKMDQEFDSPINAHVYSSRFFASS
jgi:hypothetical protein